MDNEKVHIDVKNLSDEQRAVIDCIGMDNYRKLAATFGGGFIYISKPLPIDRESRNEEIIREYNNGNSYKNIARKYQLSEVWVRKIIAGEV